MSAATHTSRYYAGRENPPAAKPPNEEEGDEADEMGIANGELANKPALTESIPPFTAPPAELLPPPGGPPPAAPLPAVIRAVTLGRPSDFGCKSGGVVKPSGSSPCCNRLAPPVLFFSSGVAIDVDRGVVAVRETGALVEADLLLLEGTDDPAKDDDDDDLPERVLAEEREEEEPEVEDEEDEEEADDAEDETEEEDDEDELDDEKEVDDDEDDEDDEIKPPDRLEGREVSPRSVRIPSVLVGERVDWEDDEEEEEEEEEERDIDPSGVSGSRSVVRSLGSSPRLRVGKRFDIDPSLSP